MTERSGVALVAVRAANIAGKPFGLNFFPRAFPNPLGDRHDAAKDVFDRIYRTNFWASDESRSGGGSEQSFALGYVRRLRSLLEEQHLKFLFDAPCGDLNWIAGLARDPQIEYEGGDISAALIADIKTSFPDLRVRQFDITSDAFPAADVWHCRDCLFHLPFGHIRAAMSNFVDSQIPFALLTTHRAVLHRNLDVEVGGFRYLDLERAPIGLPSAQAYLRDFRIGRDFPRYVGLWTRSAIAEALDRWTS